MDFIPFESAGDPNAFSFRFAWPGFVVPKYWKTGVPVPAGPGDETGPNAVFFDRDTIDKRYYLALTASPLLLHPLPYEDYKSFVSRLWEIRDLDSATNWEVHMEENGAEKAKNCDKIWVDWSTKNTVIFPPGQGERHFCSQYWKRCVVSPAHSMGSTVRKLAGIPDEIAPEDREKRDAWVAAAFEMDFTIDPGGGKVAESSESASSKIPEMKDS